MATEEDPEDEEVTQDRPEDEPAAGADSSEQPRCALHPDFAAEAACAYCGTFSCGVCLRDVDRSGSSITLRICKACLEAGHVSHQTGRTPWEQRDELGWLQGFWQTVKQVSVAPTSFFSEISTSDRLAEAAGFAFLVAIPGSIIGAAMQFVIGGATAMLPLFGMDHVMPESQASQFLLLSTTAQAVLVLVLGAPLAVLGAILSACIHHVGLLLVGGGRGGLETTVKGALYASAVQFWSVIPMFKFVTNIWVIVMQAVAYCCMHRDPGWKGAFAVLYLICLCMLAACGVALVLVLAGVGAGAGLLQ